MASVLRVAARNIIKSQSIAAPVFTRSFAWRTLKINPNADNKQHSDGQWRLAQTPVIEVSEPVIICDGGCGPTGHPMQYLRMNGPNPVNRCPYCGQTYKYVPKH